MDTHSHSIRVLVRPPPTPTHPPPLQPPPPPDPSSPRKNGVVVVGFIGKRHHDIAHLINKLIDSNVFGSGNLDTPFRVEPDKIYPEMSEWFKSRNLSYYHVEEQGILYLQFSLGDCLFAAEVPAEGRIGFESVLEDQEFGDLQGLIFMFSVCHTIILIQEGSRFDTQLLKKFRVLQAAKHTMVPFIRSQNMSSAASRPRFSAQSRISASGASPSNASPVKTQGILNRNASANTSMSGLGSCTSLLPGQCTPVVLFVFYDDFSEIQPSGNMDEPSGGSSANVPSSLNSSVRSGMPTKGPSSVVVLARPVNKSEGGLRKKLQSSLEAQIRFSIKKCRTLSTFENSHAGSRSGAIASSAPLFSLDASKAVSLVDASSIQIGESLEFAIGLVQEVLDGKATPDSLLLESHQQNTIKEDILSVKEFIYRQSDLLRGRGGLVANSSSVGVGMVAAAAAAAAASASSSTASGKTITVPDLPTLKIWSTSSQLILHRILSAKRACTREPKINWMHEKNAVTTTGETIATSSDPYESAVCHLENGIGLNTRFSTLWCENAFPVAKEVYLDDLPSCYPSFQHEDHLKKALCALASMVKGPALQFYMKRLKDECTSIWSSGRQLCDAVSLTGKPCIHQKHDIKSLSTDEIKPHSSGFVYLHACACGRSRRLRPDPFDFETANVVYNFAECDKLLPSVKLPEGIMKGPIQSSSWSLIRVGGARYYDPSKGLLQSGFFATQRFLLPWTIEKLNDTNHSLLNDSQQVSLEKNIRVETVVDADSHTSHVVQLGTDGTQNGLGLQKSLSSENDSKIVSVGRGLFNVTMRKPFSEVVAGPAAANSGFPPLLSRKQPLQDAEKVVELHNVQQRGLVKLGEIVYAQDFQKVEHIASADNAMNNGSSGNGNKYGNAFPHFGCNTVPLIMDGGEQIKAANSAKFATIYVGFEHECPRGHRFILTLDHLTDLGSSYSEAEETFVPLLLEKSDKRQDHAKLGKVGGNGRTRRQSNGVNMGGGSGKAKNLNKSKEKVANGNLSSYKSMQSTRQGKYQNVRTEVTDFVEELDSDLKSTADYHGGAFPLLNRSLPIYMNCPHCRESRTKNSTSNVKYASTTSQLQRIFVVTPSFPILLAADPIVQFELSCLPPSTPGREQNLQFSLGCPVILPPDSFLSLRLPSVYGVELEDGTVQSLKPFENQPQHTACLMRGTALRVVSDRSNINPASVT
ncbi:hypothetical protein ACS0TY_020742 [Phlomoides rotata]